MKVTEITVSYEETVSLPGYANVRPGLRLTASINDNEDSLICRDQLMDEVRSFIRHEIDQALIDNHKAPKYFNGRRFKIIESRLRKVILVVPNETTQAPDDFQGSCSSSRDVYNIKIETAESYAAEACSTKSGYVWNTITDDDYSSLPPIDEKEISHHYVDVENDIDLDEDEDDPPF